MHTHTLSQPYGFQHNHRGTTYKSIQIQISKNITMGKIKLAIIILLIAIVAYPIAKKLFYDFYIITKYPMTKENTFGKKVLVTGSSKGIGEALAYVYAQAGAHVYITARNEGALKKVSEKCISLGAASVHYSKSDFSQPGAGNLLIEKAHKTMNGLDILILNHVAPYIFETSNSVLERMQQTYRVNMLSYVESALAARPLMEKSSGSIIFVSTSGTRYHLPYCYDYCISKHSVEAFWRSFRQELLINGSSVHAGLAVLGLIDTVGARDAMQKLMKKETNEYIQFFSPEETARNIASISIARAKEITSPWYMRLLISFAEWFPESYDTQMKDIVQHKS